MATKQAQRRQELVVLGCAAVLFTSLPLLAQSKLERKVHVDLASAASENIGAPVRLGQASIGLTGTLEIRDVRVGELFKASRVIASVSPTSIGPRRLAANEILIEGPRAQIRLEEDGSTNLDGLLASRRSKRKAIQSGAPGAKPSRIEKVQLVDGALELEVVGRGQVSATGIEIQMVGDKIHGVFGETEMEMAEGPWKLAGTLPRAAFDYQRHGEGLSRVLANGGALQLTGPGGRALLQELMFSFGIGKQNWQLSARTGVDRPTGALVVQSLPRPDGLSLVLEGEEVPLLLAGPWLPEAVNPQDTRVSGKLLLTKSKTIHTDLDLSIVGLDIGESGFSTRPLRMDFDISGSAMVRQDPDAYFIESNLRWLRSSDLEMTGHVRGEWPRGSYVPRFATLRFDLAEVECDAALNALPSALRPMLAGLELRGRMKSHLALTLSRTNPDATKLDVSSGIDGCKVVREPPSANTLALNGDYEHRSPDGKPHLLKRGASGFTAIRDMPRYLPRAFVAAEDSQFFSHDGFDTHQIERSIAIDVEQGRLVRGGSTISQQLVKNLFLHRKRTLARKLQEAALTWRLESNVDKSRILEVYLNIIEFADQDIYGITAAADYWFGVEAKDLTILQTAFLAAIIPEPASMSQRIREAQGLDPQSAERVEVILRAMKRGRVISKSEYQSARRKSLEFAPGALKVGN